MLADSWLPSSPVRNSTPLPSSLLTIFRSITVNPPYPLHPITYSRSPNRFRLARDARIREVLDGARSVERAERMRADNVLVWDERDEYYLARCHQGHPRVRETHTEECVCDCVIWDVSARLIRYVSVSEGVRV